MTIFYFWPQHPFSSPNNLAETPGGFGQLGVPFWQAFEIYDAERKFWDLLKTRRPVPANWIWDNSLRWSTPCDSDKYTNCGRLCCPKCRLVHKNELEERHWVFLISPKQLRRNTGKYDIWRAELPWLLERTLVGGKPIPSPVKKLIFAFLAGGCESETTRLRLRECLG